MQEMVSGNKLFYIVRKGTSCLILNLKSIFCPFKLNCNLTPSLDANSLLHIVLSLLFIQLLSRILHFLVSDLVDM